jgi:hypothetical protein
MTDSAPRNRTGCWIIGLVIIAILFAGSAEDEARNNGKKLEELEKKLDQLDRRLGSIEAKIAPR